MSDEILYVADGAYERLQAVMAKEGEDYSPKEKDRQLNRQRCHTDPVTGICSKSRTLFFGPLGSHCTDAETIDLFLKSNKEVIVRIEMEDFRIIYWSLEHLIGSKYNEYDVFELKAKHWFKALTFADTLLSCNSFDEMFDELASWTAPGCDKGYAMWSINYVGIETWKRRNVYRMQLDEITSWTKRVLKGDDRLIIYGY